MISWLVCPPRWFVSLVIPAGLSLPAWAAPPKVDFDRDVRPIFSENCFACHGPDDKHRMAGLRFDTKEGAFAKSEVIVPGAAARSRLFARVSEANAEARMPPPYSRKTLTEKQIQTIKTWIDDGARWERHWSFVPPERKEPPQTAHPAWVRNPIDNFILARLERDGLKPSPEANKTTLLRRVTLDLTGLPPTPVEVDAFNADKSPDAYEKVVDRLLHTPQYGEKMAMQWLDLSRYADTHGYHIDSHREMWHWRDWVIDAFNRNVPYDQFTVSQLAGDLLPGATTEQKLATGFNRNHMINFEGGAIPEEYQNEYVVDRLEATSAVWLGLTMGCARCHDHKYDPIKQRDFYRFYAFFNSIPESGLDGRNGNAKPNMQLPTPEQGKRWEEVANGIEERENELPAYATAFLQAKWEKNGLDAIPSASREGLVAHYELDGSLADSSGHYQHGRVIRGDVDFPSGRVGKALELGRGVVEFGRTTAIDRADPFTLAFWFVSDDHRPVTLLSKMDGGVGYEITLGEAAPIGDLRRAGHLTFTLTHHSPDSVLSVITRYPLGQRDWHHIALTSDGSGKGAGIQLYVDGTLYPTMVLQDSLTGPVHNDAPLSAGMKTNGFSFQGRLDDLRIYNRSIAATEIETLAMHEPARAALFQTAGERSNEQKRELYTYFLRNAAPEPYRTRYNELVALRSEKEVLRKAIPTTMVMSEMAEPRATYILGRGDYRNHGETVTPGVPAMLPPLPTGAPLNRLTLAKWLVDPANPLTARVAVNRFWQTYFGFGIVKTTEDFGSQGEPPVHPELLDWLATEFIRGGWDVRAMQRLIVTSAAYRQSSRVTPALVERDPENRLLARGPRFRMPAEMVRDNALRVSGLLNPAVGGASVFPYQPKGLWEEMAFGQEYSAQTYTPSHGPDLYRRSMYTFWKRTVPPASLSTFDAPDREKCSARRLLTNTPLQALVLLNDPTYVEAARSLAQRTLQSAGPNPADRVDYAFRLATARKPDAQERHILLDLAKKKLADYQHDPDAAAKLISVGESKADDHLRAGELAAWTTVASAILNLDETITKE